MTSFQNSNNSIENYDYDLPSDRIAKEPHPDRSASRLLVYRSPGQIESKNFHDLPDVLPESAFLVLNQSKVIRARIPVVKKTGGGAEVFCLDPVLPSTDPAISLAAHESVVWNCLIGGKNIVSGDSLSASIGETKIVFEILEKDRNEAKVRITWQSANINSKVSFSEILEKVGKIPLPPYLNRVAGLKDVERYQTVYASTEGSVAAPTAGLHFTDEVLRSLNERNIETAKVLLHVGAGTFKPVAVANIQEHEMHAERIEVSFDFLAKLKKSLDQRKPVVAVGTTSLRTLESLYWMGALVTDQVSQWAWKTSEVKISGAQAIEALMNHMKQKGLDKWIGQTRIMVTPGYDFKVVDVLVTNFHQPKSTLLCLVAAFVGQANWKKIYDHALQQGYRFLSYGDSSVLFGAKYLK